MTTRDLDTDPPIELDDTDRAILRARIENARADVREIAVETGIVRNRVDERLDRLEAAGVIRGYTARVDYDRVGYDVTALLQLSITDDRVLERLSANPQFVAVYEVTGPEDVVAVGKFPDTDAMNETVTDLLTDEGVESLRTSVALDVLREFEPFAPEE